MSLAQFIVFLWTKSKNGNFSSLFVNRDYTAGNLVATLMLPSHLKLAPEKIITVNTIPQDKLLRKFSQKINKKKERRFPRTTNSFHLLSVPHHSFRSLFPGTQRMGSRGPWASRAGKDGARDKGPRNLMVEERQECEVRRRIWGTR